MVAIGIAAGLAIAAIDNFASHGEVSPIVVIALLFLASAACGFAWSQRGWVASAAAWLCLPSAHLVRHLLGLPDSLHPNTYTSILMLAAFTLVVAMIATGCGIALRSIQASLVKHG
jgi:hypothetical protein